MQSPSFAVPAVVDVRETPLADALDAALGPAAADATADASQTLDEACGTEASGARDEALALSLVHDLHLAPLTVVGARARHQHHPAVAALKQRLEASLIARLEAADEVATSEASGSIDAVAAIRSLAADDQVPEIYRWLAGEADLEQLRTFITLEGGPDGGFDDLVAICQIGLDGRARMEMAVNLWDEMGRGEPKQVHTELHRRMARALALPKLDRRQLPAEALDRSLLGSTLATNRWLQPEMVGALGTIELQAGPRCRQVVRALERVGAPADAVPFYAEHAVADPRHGKDWLDEVVGPLAAERPEEAWRMVRGARWRIVANRRFLERVGPDLMGSSAEACGAAA